MLTAVTSPARQSVADSAERLQDARQRLADAEAAHALGAAALADAQAALDAAEAGEREVGTSWAEALKRAIAAGTKTPPPAFGHGGRRSSAEAALTSANAAATQLAGELETAEAEAKAASFDLDRTTRAVLAEIVEDLSAEAAEALATLQRCRRAFTAIEPAGHTMTADGMQPFHFPPEARAVLRWELPAGPMRSPPDVALAVTEWKTFRARLADDPLARAPSDPAEEAED